MFASFNLCFATSARIWFLPDICFQLTTSSKSSRKFLETRPSILLIAGDDPIDTPPVLGFKFLIASFTNLCTSLNSFADKCSGIFARAVSAFTALSPCPACPDTASRASLTVFT